MTAPPVYHSDQTMAEGRARLQAWLPAAREDAHRNGIAELSMTELAKAQRPYLTEANLDAVVVYPGPLGGWHADVILKRVPPGVADCLGTPSHAPARTREEAEAQGRRILSLCVALGRTAAPTQAVPPTFLLHGWWIRLSPELLAAGTRLPPDREGALARIGRVLAELSPSGFDGDAYNRWPHRDRLRLLGALHRAALSGVLAYPPRYAASPSGHREANDGRTADRARPS